MTDAEARWGWFVTGFLCLFSILSFVDRTIVALLAVPIAAEFAATDVQIGLLFGTVFGLAYAVFGLPAAHFIDLGMRKNILAAGVVLWSASTALSAFAPSYGWLLVCRAAVALGEAVLSPAAISMIADLFPRSRRNLPTSVFVAVGVAMGTGSYFIGGLAVNLAAFLLPEETMSTWRATMLILGLPGVVLGLLFAAVVPEPPRLEDAGVTPTSTGFVAFLLREWRLFLVIIASVGIINLLVYGVMGWLPTILIRRFDLEPSEAGYFISLIGVPSGLIGVLGVPALCSWLERRGVQDALMLLMIVATAGAASFLFLPLASSLAVVALCLAPGFTGVAAKAALTILVIQQVAPGRMRGRFMALLLLTINLVGFGLGPLLVAVVADAWFPGPAGLAASIAALGLVVVPSAAGALLVSIPHYRRLSRRTGSLGPR